MKRLLMIATVLSLGGMAPAGPIRNMVANFRLAVAERRGTSSTCTTQAQPVREFIQAQPVRTVLANSAETAAQVIHQAGVVLRPTCSNGACR